MRRLTTPHSRDSTAGAAAGAAAAVGGLIALLALAALPGLASAAAASHTSGAQDPGRALFQGKGACFACHGREGTGGPMGPDLTDEAWIHFETRPDIEAVKGLVRDGVARPIEYPGSMPPMGGARLTEEELTAVAAYVLSLTPGPRDGGLSREGSL